MGLAFPSQTSAEALKRRYTAADGAYRYARFALVPVEGGIMRGSRLFVLAGCFAVLVFGSPAVKAGGGGTVEGGTITFVGAVVEPTCSVAGMTDDLTMVASAAQAHPALQRSCSDSMAATANARPYEVNVVHLSADEPDQVLKYFANYVRAAQSGSADPVLLTQTYE